MAITYLSKYLNVLRLIDKQGPLKYETKQKILMFLYNAEDQ
jgi:hypothetical protein